MARGIAQNDSIIFLLGSLKKVDLTLPSITFWRRNLYVYIITQFWRHAMHVFQLQFRGLVYTKTRAILFLKDSFLRIQRLSFPHFHIY